MKRFEHLLSVLVVLFWSMSLEAETCPSVSLEKFSGSFEILSIEKSYFTCESKAKKASEKVNFDGCFVSLKPIAVQSETKKKVTLSNLTIYQDSEVCDQTPGKVVSLEVRDISGYCCGRSSVRKFHESVCSGKVKMKNYLYELPCTAGGGQWAGELAFDAQKKSYSERADLQESCFLKPCKLVGDYNGDGILDKATLIVNKYNKRGIQIDMSNSKSYVIGAGAKSVTEDISWVRFWKTNRGAISEYERGVLPLPKYKGDSIEVGDTESVYFWFDGKEFQKFSQGE